MRIIQLTDLHIGRAGEETHGVDVRANFLRILERLPALAADEIVITGDLCLTDGDPGVYQWIFAQLQPLGIPIRVISGNHDDPVLLARTFGVENCLRRRELYFLRTDTPAPVFYLDTTKGKVSKQQLDWLEEELAKCMGPLVVFIHHPPLLGGVPYMDRKYALTNRDDLQEILLRHPDPIYVYCGHYHVDKCMSHYNIAVHITPSAYFQIDPFQTDFAVDHYRIGFRVIDLMPDHVLSSVIYLDGVKTTEDGNE